MSGNRRFAGAKSILVLVILLTANLSGVCKADPVEWSADDGGNGHFYEAVAEPAGISWTQADEAARLAGGHLVTITSQAENDFVFNLIDNDIYWDGPAGPWIGGYQLPEANEPDEGWRWVTSEPFIYTNWQSGQPNENQDNNEDCIHFGYGNRIPVWNDIPDIDVLITGRKIIGYIIEFSEPRILAPNGGENVVAESTYTIRWEVMPEPNTVNVLIQYSTDGGQDWGGVDIVGNTGSYDWDVPIVDSNECLVRVRYLLNPTVSDVSDDAFTIFQCQGSLTGDLNGDCYVNFVDFAVVALHWLECGNPYDPICGN